MSSSLNLDPSTLLFGISLLAVVMATVSISAARAAPKEQFGLSEWGIAMAAGAGSTLLSFTQGSAPSPLLIVATNALIMAAGAYCLLAHANLFGVAVSHRLIVAIAAFGLSGVVMAFFINDATRRLAVVTANSALAALFGMTATIVARHALRRRTPASLIATALVSVLGAALALRSLLAILGTPGAGVQTGSPRPPQTFVLVAGLLFVAGVSMAFFSMVHDRQRREALERARRDGLTGMYTRAAFFEMAEAIDGLGEAQSYAIVMVDIDNFKSINDAFGHASGDVALAHAARLIANSVRLSDLAGRYGGEEFCILLRDCDEPDAALFAQRLVVEASQQEVRIHRAREARSARFTLSAGYASRIADPTGTGRGETLSGVIERADQALYRAKRGGRNQAAATDAPSIEGASRRRRHSINLGSHDARTVRIRRRAGVKPVPHPHLHLLVRLCA
jgi:diguanylate cyclase (GGDEF)-like protein